MKKFLSEQRLANAEAAFLPIAKRMAAIFGSWQPSMA